LQQGVSPRPCVPFALVVVAAVAARSSPPHVSASRFRLSGLQGFQVCKGKGKTECMSNGAEHE